MLVRLLTLALMTVCVLAAAAATPATVWAEQPTFDVALGAKTPRPLFDTGHFPARAESRGIFERASSAEAAQIPPTQATITDHQFGLGIRLGGVAAGGIGASVRYFFGGGPVGFQGEVSRYGRDLGPVSWSSIQFAPAVMYRFRGYQFEAPLRLTPHAGGGLSIVHYNFNEDVDPLLEPFDADDTEIGALFFGGVELFFQKAPNLGVSGGLSITTHDGASGASIGGPAFTAAGHWYFR
jgi:hypothetical protein